MPEDKICHTQRKRQKSEDLNQKTVKKKLIFIDEPPKATYASI